MDIIKKKTICDLCEQPIDTTTLWVRMAYPFNDEMQARLSVEFAEMLPPPIGRILGPGYLPTPTYHIFDFCQGCVDGFMPMLEELRRKAFAHTVQQMRERRPKPKNIKRNDDGTYTIDLSGEGEEGR